MKPGLHESSDVKIGPKLGPRGINLGSKQPTPVRSIVSTQLINSASPFICHIIHQSGIGHILPQMSYAMAFLTQETSLYL